MLTVVSPSVVGGPTPGLAVVFAKPAPRAVVRESGPSALLPCRLAAKTIVRAGVADGGIAEATPIPRITSFRAVCGATGLSFQVAPLLTLTQTSPGLTAPLAGAA
jgi:hypothetical protein